MHSLVDERYIQQLKDEIVILSELRHEKRRNQSQSLSQHHHHHHHIKTMHTIRETHKLSSTAWLSDRSESIHTQLARYNYSSDPAQVRVPSSSSLARSRMSFASSCV